MESKALFGVFRQRRVECYPESQRSHAHWVLSSSFDLQARCVEIRPTLQHSHTSTRWVPFRDSKSSSRRMISIRSSLSLSGTACGTRSVSKDAAQVRVGSSRAVRCLETRTC